MSGKRKIDVDNLTNEQLKAAEDALGKKINAKIDETCKEVNSWLQRYGMVCKMQIMIDTEANFNDASRYNEVDKT